MSERKEVRERNPAEVVVAIVCDSCGLETGADGWWDSLSEDGDADHVDTRIRLRQSAYLTYQGGTWYPSGGWGEKMEKVHICPRCWRDKLIPFLSDICGREIEMVPWDY